MSVDKDENRRKTKPRDTSRRDSVRKCKVRTLGRRWTDLAKRLGGARGVGGGAEQGMMGLV